jgi:SAM-dependent methyltransferase
MTFADPYRTVPEAARLLRPGGLFAFSHHSPIETICWALGSETVGEQLVIDYFGMHHFDDGEEFVLPAPVRRLDPAVPRERIHRRGPDRAATRRRAHEHAIATRTRWRGRGAGHRGDLAPAQSVSEPVLLDLADEAVARPCSPSSASRTRSRPS